MINKKMEEIKDTLNLNIVCGICGKKAQLVKVDPPRPITEWDKANNFKRQTEYFCCGKFWFFDSDTIGIVGYKE